MEVCSERCPDSKKLMREVSGVNEAFYFVNFWDSTDSNHFNMEHVHQEVILAVTSVPPSVPPTPIFVHPPPLFFSTSLPLFLPSVS